MHVYNSIPLQPSFHISMECTYEDLPVWHQLQDKQTSCSPLKALAGAMLRLPSHKHKQHHVELRRIPATVMVASGFSIARWRRWETQKSQRIWDASCPAVWFWRQIYVEVCVCSCVASFLPLLHVHNTYSVIPEVLNVTANVELITAKCIF